MDNPELILQSLEHFPKLKDEADYSIPVELEEYMHYVAKTGDPVFQWTLVKPLFREKIIKVVTEFFESMPGEIPDYPNVNKFNYDCMKSTLLERIDWFKGAPFTIQRISELLVFPTKEYNRVDKYMRALEKNIYVVSTREPGMPQPVEENNSTFEESFILNGNDFELKSENSDMLASKEEDDNAASLLLLKRCKEVSDDANFNIEVDVTNTTPSDAQVEGITESGEINVQDETADNNETTEETLNVSDEKCGQTRKLEDDEEHCEIENEPKRFKMDDENDDENIEKDVKELEVVTEEVLTDEVDMNIEEQAKETEISSVTEPNNTSLDSQTIDSKANIEMELEETVNSKIESFDNDQSEKDSSLNLSDMVISQESSEDNVEKSIEDNVDGVGSESSDMDLSDGVTTVELKNDEISDVLDTPESGNLSATEKSNDNISDDSTLLEDKQEDKVISSIEGTIDTENTSKETIGSIQDENISEASHGVKNEIVETSKTIVGESSLSDENSKDDSNIDDAAPSATGEEINTKEEEVAKAPDVDDIQVGSPKQSTSDSIIESKASVDIPTEEAAVEGTSEISPEIEEAILQEDEYETAEPEEAGSNIDPLSTETAEPEQSVEADPSSVEEKPSETSVDTASKAQQGESTAEETQ